MADKRALSLPGGEKQQVTDSDNLLTGNVHTIDGTEGAPPHSFQNDPDSGMLSGGTNILRFSTNSNWRYQVEANGTLSVNPALDYETLATDDDDIPNKKYVDDNAGGGEALPGIEQILFVDKTSSSYTADGTISKPYNTIGAAITAATALTPSSTNKITILIYPGSYDEAVSTADSYVNIVGVDRDACIIRRIGSGVPLYVTDDNVIIANLTIDKTGDNNNFTLLVDGAVDTEFRGLRVLMDGGANDEVSLRGSSDVTFRDCIFEDVVSDANIILDDLNAGTWRFYSCTFRGYIITTASYYFNGCHFESSASAICTFTATTAQVVRMVGCSIRRTGGSGDAIRIGPGTFVDWGIIGCDIDGASGTGGEDLQVAGANPGVVHGTITGTTLASNAFQKSEVRRRVGSGGGVDVYSTLQAAIDSLFYDDGVVELMEDIDVGSTIIDTASVGRVIIEGNGFTITGTQSIEASTGSFLQIRNVKLDGLYAHLRRADSTLYLKNVQIVGSGNGPCVFVGSASTSTSKLIMNNVDADASNQTGLYALYVNSSGSPEIHINDSSFTGRNVAGAAGAAIYFDQAGAVLRAIGSLFIHQVGGASAYEINARTAVTVYTQRYMTRANAIGAAANITEGITGTNNIVDANAGFLWR